MRVIGPKKKFRFPCLYCKISEQNIFFGERYILNIDQDIWSFSKLLDVQRGQAVLVNSMYTCMYFGEGHLLMSFSIR